MSTREYFSICTSIHLIFLAIGAEIAAVSITLRVTAGIIVISYPLLLGQDSIALEKAQINK